MAWCQGMVVESLWKVGGEAVVVREGRSKQQSTVVVTVKSAFSACCM